MSIRPYMAFDRRMGAQEGAMLVFANSAQEARKVSYGLGWFNSEWCDWAATLQRDLPNHLKALDDGSVQTIESPPVCDRCHSWGGHIIKDTGCSFCVEDWELEEEAAAPSGEGTGEQG